MTSPDLIALLDHIDEDAEGIANKLGRPAVAAVIKRLKLAAESPFFLDMILLGVNFAESKIGIAAATAVVADASAAPKA